MYALLDYSGTSSSLVGDIKMVTGSGRTHDNRLIPVLYDIVFSLPWPVSRTASTCYRSIELH